MRIFVTGATGFLGSHLIPLLRKRNYELLLLSRNCSGNDFIKGDLGKSASWYRRLKKFKPEVAIHLAWEGVATYQTTPPEVAILNLENSLLLITLLSQSGCRRFVGLGSVTEYSQDVTPFIASKIALRIFGEAISRKYGMQFLWARPFYIYGPGQREAALLPSVIRSLRTGEIPEIKNPAMRQDFIYVGDVARAILVIAEKSKEASAVYEIGQGKSFPIGKLVNTAYKQIGLKARYNPKSLPKGGEKNPLVANMSSLRKLGWGPRTSFEEGIKKMVEFYRRQKNL